MSPGATIIQSMAGTVLGFPDAEGVAHYAASMFARLAKEAVWDRGVFHVALAGGATPLRTHEILGTPGFMGPVEWNSTQIYFGDERAVAPDHEDSNFHATNESLLDGLRLHSSQVHRMAGERGDLAAAARDYEAVLARTFAVKKGEGVPRFDLVMLGMGKDGHTASLFPFTGALNERDAWVVRNEVPQLSTERLTLTAPVLNAARCVLVLVTGDAKAEALERVLEGPKNPTEYPSQLVAPTDGELLWLVDEAAAAHLRRRPEVPPAIRRTA